jgi:large subunit ribosomal protein L24
MAAKIKKGDMVEVITGKDKGARGRVLDVFPAEDRVIVEGVNVQKRHIRPGTRQNLPQGGILDRPGKIHVSNVRFYSDKLGAGVRVGFTVDGDDKRRVVRGGEHAGAELD